MKRNIALEAHLKFLNKVVNSGIGFAGRFDVHDELRANLGKALISSRDIKAQRNVHALNMIKHDVWDLINKKYIEAKEGWKKIDSIDLELKNQANKIIAHNLLTYFSIIFDTENEIPNIDFINAKKSLLEKFGFEKDDDVSNIIKKVLTLTEEEEFFLLEHEYRGEKSLTALDTNNFIESFCCCLYILIYVNNNSSSLDNLIKRISDNYPDSLDENVWQAIQKIFSAKINQNIFQISIKEQINIDEIGQKNFTQLMKLRFSDVLLLLKRYKLNFEVLTSIIGVMYESGHHDSLLLLFRGFAEEFEREAVRVVNNIEEDSDIPFINPESFFGNNVKYDSNHRYIRIPYKAKDYVKAITEYKEKIEYRFDCDFLNEKPVATLSKKDVIVILRETLYYYRCPFLTMYEIGEKMFREIVEIILPIMELKWLLNIQVPVTIAKLKNGNLSGITNDNRVKFGSETNFELTSFIFSKLTMNELETTKNYLRPLVDIWCVPNEEEHHNNFTRFATEPIDDPSLNQLEIQRLIDNKE